VQLNYYALDRLVAFLRPVLTESVFTEAFSQEKDELILCFTPKATPPFYIRATLTSSLTTLSFPERFMRSRRNSVNQFTQLEGMKVTSLQMFLDERAFAIHLEGFTLLFKMHGNRSNIILFEQDRPVALFKNSLPRDLGLDLQQLDRPIERTRALYLSNSELKPFYPTFGSIPLTYLKTKGFESLSPAEQWQMLQGVTQELSTNPFYLGTMKGKPILSLLPVADAAPIGSDPIAAYNHFYATYTRLYYFSIEKQRIETEIAKQVSRTQQYIKKSEARLQSLVDDTQPEQLADILMANLHQVPRNAKSVRLFNFYNEQEISIKLNPQLSPQKNAENYYRKSKNRKIEVEKTEANVFKKYELIENLEQIRTELAHIESHKELKQFIKAHNLGKTGTSKQSESSPYKAFEFQGYKIWVGKNAKANDELTLRHAYKEDLWLHARDVPGSHVIIKHQSGKVTPKQVVERAAALAAYYSKRKTDSLIPVIVTPAKFVRKRKGSPAGQVIVSKEDVIMVPSRGPSDLSA
jgi:predicted ribosome quality control (RQC) complex YloA/Tae2 family protein